MPIRPLPKELQQIAEKELNEVPSRIQADIDHLREWVKQQPHLRARTEDQWLVTFLRGSKYSLQRAKERLDYYYTVRHLVPECQSNRDPFLPEIQEALSAGIIFPLPKTGPGEPRIILCRGWKENPDKISWNTILKVSLMIVDILMVEDDNYVVAGQSFFSDFRYLPMKRITPDFFKKVVMHFADVYPIRIKELHYTYTPASIMMIYNMVKVILTEKMRSRVFFYTGDKFESKIIPRSVLPEDYGGDGASCDEIAAEWKTKVESYRDWFLEDEKLYGTDESKRLGKTKFDNALFGVEGSFIKLEID